jgi:CubicO group peptidase (beta-lactamase class C family)
MKTRMMMPCLIVAITAMVSLPLTVHGAGMADDDGVRSAIAVLESWIETRIAYNGVPAVTVGVVHDQETVWMKGFGYADPEHRTPASPSTIFRIASISKLFTSIAVMKLRDEGKLRLDDPITAHLPWFKITNTFPDSPPVTIRHLLTHTTSVPRRSGVSYWTDFEFPTREQINRPSARQETV